MKSTLLILVILALASFSSYFFYTKGIRDGYMKAISDIEALTPTNTPTATVTPVPTATPRVTRTPAPQAPRTSTTWGGPELWVQVNKRRLENGVQALSSKDEVCTIASIRLNELLDLGKLDGHEGFSSLPDRRPDLKWIYEKYNLSEFLLSGASSAQEAVSMWENTLGHKKLLTGGEYVWGCIYAQNSFAVAITAY